MVVLSTLISRNCFSSLRWTGYAIGSSLTNLNHKFKLIGGTREQYFTGRYESSILCVKKAVTYGNKLYGRYPV